MPSNYVFWDSANIPNAVSLVQLSFEDDWELVEGEYLAENFPDDVTMRMNPDLKNDTLLVDNLINTDRIVVGSERLKGFLEEMELEKLEFLPITILDHKKKPIKDKYSIIHPVEPIDCIDFKQSKVRWSKVDPESINKVEKLVLDESKIDRKLFRLKSYFDIVVVDRSLANAIDDAGFTGNWWREIEDV